VRREAFRVTQQVVDDSLMMLSLPLESDPPVPRVCGHAVAIAPPTTPAQVASFRSGMVPEGEL